MPSFDIVSKVDVQALDNAVNVVTKEITNRFDFKGSHVVINLDKKEFQHRSQEGIEQSKACHSADSGTNDHTGQFSDHEDCHSAGLHQAPPCSGQSIGDVRP